MNLLDANAKFEIFKKLSGPGVVNLCSTNESFNDFCVKYRVWSYVFMRDYPNSRNVLRGVRERSIKENYLRKLQNEVVFYFDITENGIGNCLHNDPNENSVRIVIPTSLRNPKWYNTSKRTSEKEQLTLSDISPGSALRVKGTYNSLDNKYQLMSYIFIPFDMALSKEDYDMEIGKNKRDFIKTFYFC